MKRKLISVFLALIFCLGLAVCASAATVDEFMLSDEADLLSEQEEAALAEKLLTVGGAYKAQIVIATLDALEGTDIDTFINYAYDELELGYGENRDGVLLLVCMEPREYRILSNGYAGMAIGSSQINAIGNAIESDLSDGNYAAAFETFVDRCEYYLDGHLNGFPFHAGKKLAIALVIGIIAGVIVALVLKGQLKSVRKQERAGVYVKPGSLQISVRRDLFLYRNVERRKKESSQSSGSSGSSRSTGGGSF